MSFDKLSKKELVEAAEAFGVDPKGTAKVIVENLEAEGVDYDLWVALKNGGDTTAAPPAEPEKEEGEDVVLAYRGAASYSFGGRDWSVKAPYVVVPQSVADRAIDNEGWIFEIASAREVEEFYS